MLLGGRPSCATLEDLAYFLGPQALCLQEGEGSMVYQVCAFVCLLEQDLLWMELKAQNQQFRVWEETVDGEG